MDSNFNLNDYEVDDPDTSDDLIHAKGTLPKTARIGKLAVGELMDITTYH